MTVTDEDGLFATGTAVIKVTNVNEAVSFASNSVLKVDVAEGATAVATVAASDLDGDSLTYALSGADAGLFNVSAAGVVTFKTAPDFEDKADVGSDGVYNVTVKATDPDGLSDERDVEITVTDENEAVSFADDSTLNVSVAENQTAVATVAADDADGDDLTYTLTGDDADLFEITAAGFLTFKTNPDFETKADDDADGVYNVTVVATDDGGLSDARDVVVTVTDVAEFAEASYKLSVLVGSDGFRLNGVAASDEAGFSVSNAGDVNGDGVDDFIIGAPSADNYGTTSGSAYVVFGKLGGFDNVVELLDLTGANGFRIDGDLNYRKYGYSVSAAGDFNDDGYDDVIIGSSDSLSGGKSAYLVYGKAADFDEVVSLDGISSAEGSKIFTHISANWAFAEAVSGVGDVNGDGYDDILIGAKKASYGADSQQGISYVVFGRSASISDFDLANLNGVNGLALKGALDSDQAGNRVSGLGDINGDGYADFAVTSQLADVSGGLDAGQVSVVYGKANFLGNGGEVNTGALSGLGFNILRAAEDDRVNNVSSAGDVNGDGYDDVLIGVRLADNGNLTSSGSSYVLFGTATKHTQDISLADLDGTNGFRLDGVGRMIIRVIVCHRQVTLMVMGLMTC